ncbi:MAG: hypothetical protein Q4F28_07255 [Eubacteriales bacterium]|nr:hypothetical protein [Eubacteriales bacterium]
MTEQNKCEAAGKRIPASNMLLFGAAGRNLGKTELAERMIEAYAKAGPVAAVKVVTVHNHGDICPRGGKGCGICKGLKSCFDIHEEHGTGNKDTMRFAKAGARPVYLVRAYPEGLAEAMKAVLDQIVRTEPEAMVICESNSVANVVKPRAFLMIGDEGGAWKPSAVKAVSFADEILESRESEFCRILEKYGPK